MSPFRPHESVPVWVEQVEMPHFPQLNENISTDVCIVGAGIAGLTTAYLLQKAGKKVCVLESFEVGSGQSGKTTAHFATALDDRYFHLEQMHGMNAMALVADSHKKALQFVSDVVRAENIACDLAWVDGYLLSYPDSEDEQEILQQELVACYRAGFRDVRLTSRAPFPWLDTGPCLHFPKQLQLHPLKYLKALSEIIVSRGGKIYTHTHGVKFVGGEEAFVETGSGFQVSCGAIVMATNTPVNDIVTIHTKQAAYRSYVIGVQIPKGSVPATLFWDTLDPYHYVRVTESSRRDFDILIVGGEDHKTGQEKEPLQAYQRLEEWTRQHFPMAGATVDKWSGQIMEPVDGLAYLGRNPGDKDNVFIMTGDSGNGMTHATIGAMIISDQILGRENPWEHVYSPSRVSLMATGQFLEENINVTAQYIQWLWRREKKSLDELPPGQGQILRDGLQAYAIYREWNGQLRIMSAVCPHLAGLVSWNSAEKSWDCPCHGSRFSCHGQVIEGPAVRGLKTYSAEEIRTGLSEAPQPQSPHPI